MADEPLPVQSGILDPLIGMGFITPNMSLEEIKRRRAIGAALASRKRDYPKTIGEGMTYFSEAIADTIQDRRLAEAEKAYSTKRDAEFPAIGAPVAVPAAPVSRPVADVPPAVAPAPTPTVAAINPLTVEPTSGPASRAAIYQALAARNGAVPPRPTAAAPLISPTVGATPASVGSDGATFAEEGGPNPPTITSAIKPMLVADASRARGGVGTIPGAFDPRAREPATPVEMPSGPPVEPQLGAETPREQMLKAYQRKYRDDPIAVQNAQQGIDTLKQQREKDWVIRHEKWKIDYADHLKQNDPKYKQDLINSAKENRRKDEDYTQFPLGLEKHDAKVKESFESVKNIPKAQTAISNVRALMNSDAGMFTGADANVSLGLQKLGQALGAPIDPKASNTETFRGMIVPILSMLRPAIVGPGAQALPELQMLKDAAAGNITLERKTIENILGVIEKQGLLDAVDHHRRIIANAGDGPRSNTMRQLWSSEYGLPMEQLVPPGTVKMLREEIAKAGDDTAKIKAEMEEFDKDHYTPGLARKLLGR